MRSASSSDMSQASWLMVELSAVSGGRAGCGRCRMRRSGKAVAAVGEGCSWQSNQRVLSWQRAQADVAWGRGIGRFSCHKCQRALLCFGHNPSLHQLWNIFNGYCAAKAVWPVKHRETVIRPMNKIHFCQGMWTSSSTNSARTNLR